jgi:hypothetical protein
MAEYKTSGSSALAPDDPYNEMERSDIRPNLRVIEGGGQGDGKPSGNLRVAAKDLSNAEQSATANPISTIAGGADEAKSAEQDQPYSPRFTGKGLPGGKNDDKKGKGKGFLKRRGPLIAIVTMLIGGGGLMAGVQSLMPFSLLAQFQETFDSIKTVSELRSNSFMGYQLDPNRVKNPIRATMFGKTKFKITGRQEAKLKKQGITVDRDFKYTNSSGSTKTITVLKFDDGYGPDPMIIVPDAKLQAEVDAFVMSGGLKGADGVTTIMPPVHSFKNAGDDIADFRNGYIKGSRTWRGSVGAWFGSVTVKFLQSNKLTRNMFKDFQKRIEDEAAGNRKTAAEEIMKHNLPSEGQEVDAKNMTDEEYEVSDEDGSYTVHENGVKQNGLFSKLDNFIYKGNKAAIEAKLNEMGNGMNAKVSGVANAVVNVACTVFNFIGAVNLLLVAHESLQIIQLVSGYFEAIQKVQAGDGADSPLNELSNGLTTGANTTDDDGVVVRENMSAMESNGISAIYGNLPMNRNDPSVGSFNIGNRVHGIMGAIGISMASYMGCALAKAAAAIAGAALDVITIVGCVASFGIGCVVRVLMDAGSNIVSSSVIAAAVKTASSLLTPLAFKIFSRDLITNLAGEDLGNAIVSGANMYMGSNHKSGGGSPTNSAGFTKFISAQQQVIANEAQYQRETLSPFDITSKYTFMGSLATSLMSLSTQTKSFTSTIAGVGNFVGKSVSAILPSASALHATNTVTSYGDCPDLESIGAVGDAFCNPYIVSDVNTLGNETPDNDPWDPADVIERMDEKYSSFIKKDEPVEVPEIDGGSNLAKYIVFCNERSSPYGVADQNIAGEVANFADVGTGVSFVDTTANSVIGAIPVLGDAVDITQNAQAIANAGWVSGEACVLGNNAHNDLASATPGWEETKNYQRFVEDQRLAEAMGLVEKSAVTAFLDKYYNEHPLDNSYEGILARKTGMTKETVIATLDQLKEYSFLAEYNPTELYPVPNYSAYTETGLSDQLPTLSIADHYTNPTPYLVIYADTRTRNYAA